MNAMAFVKYLIINGLFLERSRGRIIAPGPEMVDEVGSYRKTRRMLPRLQNGSQGIVKKQNQDCNKGFPNVFEFNKPGGTIHFVHD